MSGGGAALEQAPSRALRSAQRIGTTTAGALLISNVIGSGIFTTTGFLARDLGDPRLVLLVWVVGAVLALAGALSYAELGAALPRSGGEYVYLRRAYGPLAGFLGGWTSFTMGFGAAIAAAATSFALFLHELLPPALGALPSELYALSLVWALTAVHARGVGPGGHMQRAFAAAKVVGIAAFIGFGLWFGNGDWTNLTAAPRAEPALAPFAVSLVFVLYAFSGWNAAGYIAAELRDPARSLPRATIAGTVLVAALYLALNVVYLYALPVSELAAEPVVPVAEKAATALFAGTAGSAISALLCISIAGAASCLMFWFR